LVNEAISCGVEVIPLPGPAAFLTALIASGMAIHSFKFFGFPPQKKGRQTFLREACDEPSTIIFYESTYKIHKLIDELSEICDSSRRICIARELTKIYEEFIRGTIAEVKTLFETKNNLKGEFVVILEGKK
jgi:16S rRNA (cytidine1402-2'-O)-methyltransferase